MSIVSETSLTFTEGLIAFEQVREHSWLEEAEIVLHSACAQTLWCKYFFSWCVFAKKENTQALRRCLFSVTSARCRPKREVMNAVTKVTPAAVDKLFDTKYW